MLKRRPLDLRTDDLGMNDMGPRNVGAVNFDMHDMADGYFGTSSGPLTQFGRPETLYVVVDPLYTGPQSADTGAYGLHFFGLARRGVLNDQRLEAGKACPIAGYGDQSIALVHGFGMFSGLLGRGVSRYCGGGRSACAPRYSGGRRIGACGRRLVNGGRWALRLDRGIT
jgi:hypothetical protein